MTYEEAMAYIGTLGMGKKEPGLENMKKLMAQLGDPQDSLRYVHVAGTNGKGSVCAMLSEILQASGYKTGLYTSPYIQRFNERIRINGKPIDDGALAKLCEEVRAAAEKTGERFSEFEFDTAMGFLHFAREKCDMVVLETGLGGRLDPTNIIAPPECAVMTNIGLDHTEILGNTIEKIAMEKAGILKQGSALVLYEPPEDCDIVFPLAALCREKGASFRMPDFSEIDYLDDTLEGISFTYCYEGPFFVPLAGEHQAKNAAVVLECVEALRGRGFRLPHEKVVEGLKNTRWPARFELVHEEPYVIIDGGHNPQCAEVVAENMYYYFEEQRRVFLFGIMKDKDVEAVAERISVSGHVFICVTLDSPRAMPGEELAKLFADYKVPVFVAGSVEEGIDMAMRAAGKKGAVCCTGSLYLAGAVRDYFGLE